jgi:glycosyltransferase involved in cell wall biosynthesis
MKTNIKRITIISCCFFILSTLITNFIINKNNNENENSTKITLDLNQVSNSFFNNKDGGAIQVCFTLPAFIPFGGIEVWFKGLVDILKEDERINLHGLYVWDIRSPALWNYSISSKILILNEVKQVQEQCHVTISTAFRAIKNNINIMTIHGGSNSDWTKQYARYSNFYDYIVGVSLDSRYTLPSVDQSKMIYVPSYIHNKTCQNKSKSRFRYCKKQLLFAGRISSEKRPELFCESLKHLTDYCGVVVGPVYYYSNKFTCDSSNVIYVGSSENVQCYMENSEALLVPSDSEGGPIVAIEAWLKGLPVIMKSTGLAKQYSDGFIIYNWDNPNFEQLRTILEDVTLLHNVNLNSRIILDENFSKKVVKNKWRLIFDDVEAKMSKTNIYNFILLSNEGSMSRILGKMVIIDCMHDKCHTIIRFTQTTMSFCFKYHSSGPIFDIKFSVSGKNFLTSREILNSKGKLCFKFGLEDNFHLDVQLGYNQIQLYDFFI